MENESKKSFVKKLGEVILEFLGELIAVVIFFAIGMGIMALLGNTDALETVDSDLIVLLGAVAVLAAFGILFAVIAIVRKIKRR